MKPAAVLILAAALSACATAPTPERPEPGIALTGYVNQLLPDRVDEAQLTRWWTALGDPILDRLVREALERNLDLAVARARIRQARAQRRIAGADREPQLNANAVAQRQRISESVIPFGNESGGGSGGDGGGGTLGGGGAGGGGAGAGGGASSLFSGLPGSAINFFQLGFDARWELDLFGAVAQTEAGAAARVAAAELQAQDIQTALAAELVRDYVSLRELQARRAVAEDNLTAARGTAAVVGERERAGLVSRFDSARAEAAVLSLAATLPQLDTQIRQTAHRLAVLTARAPGELLGLLETKAPLPPVPAPMAAGIPSELLRRRADIRAAEAQLAAATYEQGAAIARLYPQFTLQGSWGLQSAELDTLLDWGSRFYNLAANLLAPILDGGRRRGTVALRRAEVDEALARYRLAVLGAFQDTEDALVALDQDRRRLALREQEVALRERAVGISREQYRAGLIGLTDVLEAEQQRFQAADAAAAIQAAVIADWVALQKALGGGWLPDAVAEGSEGEQ